MNRQLIILALVTAITLLLGAYGGENKKQKLIAIVSVSFVMAAYLGLRTWWLADNIKYHTQFLTVGPQSLWEMLDDRIFNVGLRYYFHIIYTYFDQNFQIVFIGIAILQISCLGYIIYRYSSSVFLSYFTYIFLGFYYFIFSGLKQGVAMAFLMLAFSGVMDQKPMKFLIFTLIASMFHAPAFIFIIAYPWANAKVGRYYFMFLVGVFFIVLLFRTQIVGVLSEMYYEDAELVASGRIGGRFIAMAMILILSMLLRSPVPSDANYYRTFNIMVLATLIQSFSIFGNNFTRLADYYFQFSAIFIPFILTYREQEEIEDEAVPILRFTRQSYVIACLVFCLLGTAYYHNYTKDDIFGIANAKFFWEVSQTPWGS